MSIQKSIVIMSNTGEAYDVTGDAFRADSYYGYTDGRHTVSVTYYNFVGNFHIQGTLSITPEESDWFDIGINTTNNAIPYIEFNGESGTNAFTFVGNFTYVRALMNRTERDDISPNPLNGLAKEDQGLINKVLLAM